MTKTQDLLLFMDGAAALPSPPTCSMRNTEPGLSSR